MIESRDSFSGRGEIHMNRLLVTGAGGFIGHHLVTYLKERGVLGEGGRRQAAGIHEVGCR